ncbi:HalOD1 output domain-containing protein [Haladaptatus salinisoli]|uniref:HalOD1 output domain-containing protein n=1 Tax=Haladaptatus salinisoli TaxID=2884876 RepID=UPI001D09F9DF|nr:HalOD1 output domain-containing protein [Haladaptatus salinisoli]
MTNHTPSNDENHDQSDHDTHRTEFDPSTDSASEELITAIATLNDADPAELALLAEFVDPEALDALFGPQMDGTPRDTTGHVVFNYDAYHVRIDSNGKISLRRTEVETGSERSLSDDDE